MSLPRFDWSQLQHVRPLRCWIAGDRDPVLLDAWLKRLGEFDRSIYVTMMDHSDPGDRFGRFLAEQQEQEPSGRALVLLIGPFRSEFFAGANFQTLMRVHESAGIWIVGSTPENEAWLGRDRLDYVLRPHRDALLLVEQPQSGAVSWLPRNVQQWDAEEEHRAASPTEQHSNACPLM